jgi:hypothetical protein
VLAAERRVPVDEAFAVIRCHARSRGANLHAVTVAVVHAGLPPLRSDLATVHHRPVCPASASIRSCCERLQWLACAGANCVGESLIVPLGILDTPIEVCLRHFTASRG